MSKNYFPIAAQPDLGGSVFVLAIVNNFDARLFADARA